MNDVKAKRVTGTGSLAVGPARIRTLHGTTSGGAARLTITDGNGGATVLDVDAHDVSAGSGGTFTLEIPDAGIRCSTDVFIATATNVDALTVIYS